VAGVRELRSAVGRVLPVTVKRRVRHLLGSPYREAPGRLERNPSWNSVPLEFYLNDWLTAQRPANEGSQELLLEYLAQTLAVTEGKLSLLDVACGNGRFHRGLDTAGLLPRIDYRGTDITPKLVEACRILMPDVPFDEASMEELPYDDSSFDVVVCQHAIQYLPYYDRVIPEFLRVTRRLVLVVVKGVGESDDHLGTYWNDRHQQYFRANMYEPDRLKVAEPFLVREQFRVSGHAVTPSPARDRPGR